MKRGEELVTGGAYYILTSLEDRFVDKRNIAAELNTTVGLLERLGVLASTEDPTYGRKAGGRPGPLSQEDLLWLRAACRCLIARLLRHEAGVAMPELLTADNVGPP